MSRKSKKSKVKQSRRRKSCDRLWIKMQLEREQVEAKPLHKGA